MKGESTADDLQAQGFHFLKKRKKRKQREYNQECENGERGRAETTELGPASPLLFEAAQRGERRKKKKKHKSQRQEQHFLLDNSCLGGENNSSEVTEGAASQKKKKKKKKKKLKHSESPEDERERSGDPWKQQSSDSCPESTAAHPEPKQTSKKKRKHKVSGEDEEGELAASDTGDKNECKRPKKKAKKKRGSRTPAVQEEPLTPPEQHRQEADTPLPSPTREGAVSMLQPLDEDAASDSSPGWREDPRDLSAHFSKGTKASQRKAPGCARKKKKSRVFVIEESSSESETMTPGPWASRKKASRKKDRNNSFTEMAASDELNLDNEETLNSTVSSAVDLDTAKQELEEFIPHVRNIADSSIRKMAGRDLTRFKQFKRQGIAVKFGRFSQKENNQIRKNVEEFLAITGIDSAEKLLFTSRYPEEKGTISRLKAEHLFCEKISEGIPRPWRLIYYRARKMFDPNNYKGRYSREEKEKLKKYHALYGNDWKKIAGMMSRSNLSVAMKYSEIKSAINYGPWSKEEIQKLMNAMEEVIRKRLEDTNPLTSSGKSSRDLLIDREKLFQKFPWTEIEAKVGTRYWRQCKQKWNTILRNKMTKGQQLYRGTKALQAKINLIKRLYEMGVEDANEVNWEELSNTIGDVPREYVQAKFYKLKVTCVPFWQKKTFSEIIDYLFEKKLPEFEEDLKKRKQKKLSSDSSTAKKQKKAFHLSDIFDSSEESD
ncbi:transcription termination factor 1 [Calypte anna]|nr:transcription termination factor 1 [Calypte anna]XP_030316933.1 transcription termination factor 1 [Calypte anna]XP_030316934.1 transcription termination factor 1 [Calypte anna]